MYLQRVWETVELGVAAVRKHRFAKTYRLPELDAQLTASRLRQEVRSLIRTRKLGIPTPTLLSADPESGTMILERIDGVPLKEALQKEGYFTKEDKSSILKHLGKIIGKLHDGDIIHGDLTTSNVLVTTNDANFHPDLSAPQSNGAKFNLVLIDFGLSQFSTLSEDRAVDLYVLERSFSSAHSADAAVKFDDFLTSYRHTSKNWSSTFNKLSDGTNSTR